MLVRFALIFSICCCLCLGTKAQSAEVSIGLSEPFFDALLDSVFKNFDPPQFTVAAYDAKAKVDAENATIESRMFSYVNAFFHPDAKRSAERFGSCEQSIKLLREMNGVQTAVRFRDGKIHVPLAFSGNYDVPLVGCVEFSGWAATNVDLEFDNANQRMTGRVRVVNVHLTGTRGFGGTVIARMLQSSIDNKFNPVEIMRLEKLSFGVPISGKGNLNMKAVAARTEITNGAINIRLDYQFSKG